MVEKQNKQTCRLSLAELSQSPKITESDLAMLRELYTRQQRMSMVSSYEKIEDEKIV